jgi:hypothetical protein
MSWLPHIPVRSEQDATQNFEAIAALIIRGRGSPEGRVAAPVGVIYLREDGKPGETMYVKEEAVGPTDTNGWRGGGTF